MTQEVKSWPVLTTSSLRRENGDYISPDELYIRLLLKCRWLLSHIPDLHLPSQIYGSGCHKFILTRAPLSPGQFYAHWEWGSLWISLTWGIEGIKVSLWLERAHCGHRLKLIVNKHLLPLKQKSSEKKKKVILDNQRHYKEIF